MRSDKTLAPLLRVEAGRSRPKAVAPLDGRHKRHAYEAWLQVMTPTDHIDAAAAHAGVGSVIAATVLGWLPPALGLVAGVLGIVWYAICIYESHTFQVLMDRIKGTKPNG